MKCQLRYKTLNNIIVIKLGLTWQIYIYIFGNDVGNNISFYT